MKLLVSKTLKKHDLYSKDAEFLVLCTIAQESHNGSYIRQAVKNFTYNRHAIGIAQMEKNTFDWLYGKYGQLYGDATFKELEYNLELSILYCRLRYRVIKEPLPNRDDFNAVWWYYKIYYNSIKGSATKEEFTKNYKKYVK